MRAFVVGAYVSANFLFVPSLPRAGQTAAATSYFHDHGGKGLNLAIGLHRLGVATSLLLSVGDDARGREITQKLREMGLSTEHVHTAEVGSAFGIGLIAPDGSNLLAAYMGANALLGETQVEQARKAIEAAGFCLGQFEAPEPAILAAFRIAKAAGRLTYLNPSPWRQPSDELLGLTDIMVVNEPEAMDFLAVSTAGAPADVWARDLSELAERRGWRGEILVVTLAERGAVALKRGACTVVPAFPVEQIDATGAGDGFGCGLVSALVAGETLEGALQKASACGALVASKKGVFDALPHAEELEKFLSSRSPAPG